MSLSYIRKTYGVPAFRGQPVRYTGGSAPQEGKITSSAGAYIRIRMDGEDRFTKSYHPTWEIEYLTKREATT